MTDLLDDLNFECVEKDNGDLLLTWNEYNPLAQEHLNHWTMDDWMQILRDEAGRMIRLHGGESVDLW